MVLAHKMNLTLNTLHETSTSVTTEVFESQGVIYYHLRVEVGLVMWYGITTPGP